MVEDLATKYRSKVDITEAFLSRNDVQERKRASGLDLKVFMVGDAQEPLYQGVWSGLQLTERIAHIFMFEKALTLSDDAYFGYLASSVGYVFFVSDIIVRVPQAKVPIVLQQVQAPEVKMAIGDILAIDYFGIDIVPSRVEMYLRDIKSNMVPFDFLKYLAKLEKRNPEHARRIRMQTIHAHSAE